MKLSLPQRFHKYYDKPHNLEIIKQELKQTEADLLVFPELFLTGYRIRDKILEQSEIFLLAINEIQTQLP